MENLNATVDRALSWDADPKRAEAFTCHAARLGVATSPAAVAADAFRRTTGVELAGMHGLFCLAEALLDLLAAGEAATPAAVRGVIENGFASPFPPPLPDTPDRLDSVESLEALTEAQESYSLRAARDIAQGDPGLAAALGRLDRADDDKAAMLAADAASDRLVRVATSVLQTALA